MNGNGMEPRRPGRLRILSAALLLSLASAFGLYYALEAGSLFPSLACAGLFLTSLALTLWQG